MTAIIARLPENRALCHGSPPFEEKSDAGEGKPRLPEKNIFACHKKKTSRRRRTSWNPDEADGGKGRRARRSAASG